jgi:hypothetical protein
MEKLKASPPQNSKQLLYFKIDYCLMIIVPTHKYHKSPFQHSKIIYVFTFRRIIVTIQLHNIINFLKGVKMNIANWTINIV